MPFVDWVAMGQKFRRFPAGDAVEQVIQVTREQGRRFGIGEAAGDLPLELERAGFAEPDVGVLNADLKEHLSDYILTRRGTGGRTGPDGGIQLRSESEPAAARAGRLP